MTQVLHIMPEGVFANSYHGSYKDVISRIRWFESSVESYQQMRVKSDDAGLVEFAVKTFQPTHVLMEYTHFPKIIKRLKTQWPGLWIGVRAHNIEPLQHYDNHGWWSSRGPLWMGYGMARLLCQDIAVKRMADVILSINSRENDGYWSRLPGRAAVEWLPYTCPDHLIPAHPQQHEQRSVIACIPTSQENRKSRDLVLRFFDFAREIKRWGSSFDFVVTGRLESWDLPACPEVERVGFVDDLAEFFGRCRAVAMLSPLGYGFKTTMADAWAAGAHVLAHPALIRRCPEAVRPGLIPVDTAKAASLVEGLEQLQHDPAAVELHLFLAQRFGKIMKKWFLACQK